MSGPFTTITVDDYHRLQDKAMLLREVLDAAKAMEDFLALSIDTMHMNWGKADEVLAKFREKRDKALVSK